MDLTWQSEKRLISDLKPNPKNPRQAKESQVYNVSQSLKKFSLADPLIINLDNTLIGGHLRLSVLKEQGITEVDIRVPSRLLNEQEAEELMIRLNKNTGDWNNDLLASFDESLLLESGFSQKELEFAFDLNNNINFDNIESTEDRQRQFKDELVTCPQCNHSFNIKI